MSAVELFHGSQTIVERPILGVGNPRNDYGLGFYCTPEKEFACEWACSEASAGYVNAYTFDITQLKVLELTSGEYTILHWLAILLRHRSFKLKGDIAPLAKEFLLERFYLPVEEYDVVRGYRADDSYFSFANAFISGSISLRKLEEAMMLGGLGEQIVPRTQKAYDALYFEGAQAIDYEHYFPLRIARDEKARKDFANMKANRSPLLKPHITDILKEDWGPDDARLQRIVLR